ncbi:D-alanyl-D-alanine carboxypeptidase/D-alanyl-D-alanine-endopeptidase [Mechercharimyces sp. CAU 1602]|uniref:D-alanyl-D-alanine carboxypeptidase/D-alanyl-D-alanine endopeptidase n=1 Tax=Mechercharimyces sp. CAU 1602 TaxID=2973933 RepID=UPI00216369C9|nr:D-alanyl-D-alanine carboxypeptidase/D-alanyl-D-alanine-endopeptidase [Mechercharimyces sp. CAU 1602]MCS1350515.1 D-alanyl-D-alanine carboxypeptidase/D-alanyl-D-alanine-endopeptidase [Mechercharimyces sp. CAU 1602]
MFRQEWDKMVHQWRKRTKEWGAHIGCAIYTPTGLPFFMEEASRWFLPASNQKIWTTAVAIAELGLDYQWKTRAGLDHDGGLWLQGGGDPAFSFTEAKALGKELLRAGVTEISGHVYVDDKAWKAPFWGEGWKWDERILGYAAPIHALNFDRNRMLFRADPSSNHPELTRQSPCEWIRLEQRVTWAEPGKQTKLSIRRDNHHIYIKGELDRNHPEVFVAVKRGPHHFANGIVTTLKDMGLNIRNKTSILPYYFAEDLPLLWEHRSPPLRKLLAEVNGDSDNLIAEVLLKTLGNGNIEKGRVRVHHCIERWGLTPHPSYRDGSGLSVHNLASPEQTVQLLHYLYKELPWAPELINSFASYGRSGTLQERALILPKGVEIKAKTGTLRDVKNISGYISVEGECKWIFSLLINHLLHEQDGEWLQDQLLAMLIDWQGRRGS